MKKLLLLCSVLSLSVLWPGDAIAQLKIGGKKLNTAKLLDAGKDVAKAVTLSDSDIAQLSREAVAWMDANNPVADETTEYGARLKRLTEGITEVDGLPLNFKVYKVADVNAFACGDGSIRVFSALMDLMDDDELMDITRARNRARSPRRHKTCDEKRLPGIRGPQCCRGCGRKQAGQAERLAAGRIGDGLHRCAILAETGV